MRRRTTKKKTTYKNTTSNYKGAYLFQKVGVSESPEISLTRAHDNFIMRTASLSLSLLSSPPGKKLLGPLLVIHSLTLSLAGFPHRHNVARVPPCYENKILLYALLFLFFYSALSLVLCVVQPHFLYSYTSTTALPHRHLFFHNWLFPSSFFFSFLFLLLLVLWRLTLSL